MDSSNSFLESVLLPYLVAFKVINPFHHEKAMKCARIKKQLMLITCLARAKIFCYDIQDWDDPHKTLYPFQNHNGLSYKDFHILFS